MEKVNEEEVLSLRTAKRQRLEDDVWVTAHSDVEKDYADVDDRTREVASQILHTALAVFGAHIPPGREHVMAYLKGQRPVVDPCAVDVYRVFIALCHGVNDRVQCGQFDLKVDPLAVRWILSALVKRGFDVNHVMALEQLDGYTPLTAAVYLSREMTLALLDLPPGYGLRVDMRNAHGDLALRMVVIRLLHFDNDVCLLYWSAWVGTFYDVFERLMQRCTDESLVAPPPPEPVPHSLNRYLTGCVGCTAFMAVCRFRSDIGIDVWAQKKSLARAMYQAFMTRALGDRGSPFAAVLMRQHTSEHTNIYDELTVLANLIRDYRTRAPGMLNDVLCSGDVPLLAPELVRLVVSYAIAPDS